MSQRRSAVKNPTAHSCYGPPLRCRQAKMAIHRANIAMPPSSVSTATTPVFRVDIPLLPETAVGNALQFIDLLRSANLLAGLRLGTGGPRLTWRLLDATGAPLAMLP